MSSPVVNDLPASNDPRRDSANSTGILLIWTAAAAALLVHIFGVMFVLRRDGYMLDPLYGFPATAGSIAGMVLAAITVRCIVLKWFPTAESPGCPTGWRSHARIGVELAVITLVYTLTAFACAWPKVMIPALNPRLWDGALIEIDTALCFGVNPNEFLLTVFQGAPGAAAWLLDHHYALFVLSQGLASAWFLSDPKPGRRIAFGLSVILLWLVGTWSYVILPALGPVYAVEGFLPRIAETFPINSGAQVALLKNYENVHLVMGGETALISPHFGIAAMPSLHVAVHFFLFFWARFVASRLRHLLLAMATLTFIGSVAIGWHYLVDGLVGLAFAGGAFAVAVVIFRKTARVGFISDPR